MIKMSKCIGKDKLGSTEVNYYVYVGKKPSIVLVLCRSWNMFTTTYSVKISRNRGV